MARITTPDDRLGGKMEIENLIPDAVRRQAEEADRLLKSVAEGDGNATEETASTEQPVIDTASDTVAPESEIVVESEVNHATDSSDAEHTTDNSEWEQKFKSLKGRHKKEIKDLAEKVNLLTVQNMQLSRLLSERQSSTKTSQNTDEANESVPYDLSKLNPDAFDDYGDEFKEMAKLNLQLAKDVDTLKKELSSRDTAKEIAHANDSAKTLHNEIERLCPNYLEQNTDEGFNAWLSPAKKQLLVSAYADGDAETVAEIFNAYRTIAKKNFNDDTDEDVIPASVAKQVQPTKNRQGDVPTVKTYSVAEIEKFTRDFTAGRLKMSDDAAKRMRADIDAAIMEGRVTA